MQLEPMSTLRLGAEIEIHMVETAVQVVIQLAAIA